MWATTSAINQGAWGMNDLILFNTTDTKPKQTVPSLDHHLDQDPATPHDHRRSEEQERVEKGERAVAWVGG